MSKKIISLIMAFMMVLAIPMSSVKAEGKVEKTVIINVEVVVEGVEHVILPTENFIVPIDNKLEEKAAIAEVKKAIKEKVTFDQVSELAEDSIKLTTWVKDGEDPVTATFEAVTMPKFRIMYSNKVLNIEKHLKDLYIPTGSTRLEVLERVKNEIRDVKFEDGFELESIQILGGVFEEAEQLDEDYIVYVYAQPKATVEPENPETPVDPENPEEPVMDLNKDVAEIAKAVKVNMNKEGKVLAEFPIIKDGRTLSITVYDDKTNNKLASADLTGHKSVVLPVVGETSTYRIEMTLIDNKSGKRSDVNKLVKEFKTDKIAPVLNYAYVIGGRVVLNIISPVGLDEKTPIVYRMKGETDFQVIDRWFGYGQDFNYGESYWDDHHSRWDEIFNGLKYDKYKRLDENDYAIDVEVPSVLQLVAIDKLGNKTPIELEIKKDNVALTKSYPKYLNDLIKSAWGEVVNKYKDGLVTVDKNTSLNLFEVYEKEIVKEFKRFNIRALSFYVNGEEVTKWDNFKFDEIGRYAVEIENTRNADTFKYTVLALGKNENIRSFKIFKPATAKKYDMFTGADALDITTTKNKEAKPEAFFFEYDGKYYPIETEIRFPDDKEEVEVVIYNKGESKSYKTTIKRGEGIDSSTIDKGNGYVHTGFSDVNGEWFFTPVTTVAAEGLIKGYPDGSFKPNNMISKRETLALAGRLMNQHKQYAKPVVNNKKIESSWAEDEINAAYSRIPAGKLNTTNLDAAITREEVALIFNSILTYKTTDVKYLSDINNSQYTNDIQTLVSTGIINGYPDGTFRPALEISRAELAQIMFNALMSYVK